MYYSETTHPSLLKSFASMLSHYHKQVKITVHPRFVVKYLGCCEAEFNEDTDEHFHAKLSEIQQANAQKIHANHLNKMIMTITEQGMTINCPKYGKRYFFPVHRIGSCGRENKNRALMFTYKPRDSQLECHAVLCSSEEDSIELKDAMAWMFKAATLMHKHELTADEQQQSKSMTPPPKRKQKPPFNRTSSAL